MKIKLIESITHCSEPLAAGSEIELPEGEAKALIAAGHAKVVAAESPSESIKEKSK